MKVNKSDRDQNTPLDLSDYDLKIDTQVEKFLEMKHKVVFFLMTAAIGSIGYTLKFSVDKLDAITAHPWRIAFLLAGTIAGLLAAGSVLYSLSQEVNSYQLHIKNRYLRKSWDQLSEDEQISWDKINHRAHISQRLAFVLLIISIAFQAALFALFLI
jgi:hypothetical protein